MLHLRRCPESSASCAGISFPCGHYRTAFPRGLFTPQGDSQRSRKMTQPRPLHHWRKPDTGALSGHRWRVRVRPRLTRATTIFSKKRVKLLLSIELNSYVVCRHGLGEKKDGLPVIDKLDRPRLTSRVSSVTITAIRLERGSGLLVLESRCRGHTCLPTGGVGDKSWRPGAGFRSS